MADAQKVLQALSERAKNWPEIAEKFNAMDQSGQRSFIEQAARQLGIGDVMPSPESVGAQAFQQSKRSAYEAFQGGDPRASKISDSGAQQYAVPVSAPAAFASSALETAGEIPFVGNMASKAISGLTGQSEEDLQAFQQAAREQQSVATGLGSGAGIALGGELLAAGGTAVAESAKAVGKAFKSLASVAVPPVIKYGAKAAQVLGVPGANRVAAILLDDAAAASAKVLGKEKNLIDAGLREVTPKLKQAYSKLDDAIDPNSLHTGASARDLLETEMVRRYKDREKPKGWIDDVREQIDRWYGDIPATDKVNPSKWWGKTTAISGESKKFSGRGATAKENSTAGILNDLDNIARDVLDTYAKGVIDPTGKATLSAELLQASKDYRLLKSGSSELASKLKRINKKEVPQLASNRAAEILSKGEKLGPYYKVLTGALRRGGLPTAAAVHANLLRSDAKYRDLIDSLVPASQEPQDNEVSGLEP